MPPIVSGVPRDRIIQCYYSSLDKQSKLEIHQSFLRGETRILICTDAYGLGIDIPDVVRVIQWWVDEKFTIFGVSQRMGRAVRNPSLVGVGVVYVQKSLLEDIKEGDWESAWSDPSQFPEDDWDPDTGGIRVIPVSKSRKLPLFGLPVREDTLELVRTHVRHLYKEVTTFHEAIREAKTEMTGTRTSPVSLAKKLDPGTFWFLKTKGCRHAVLAVMFEDEDVLSTEHKGWYCDNCALASTRHISGLELCGFGPADSISDELRPSTSTLAGTSEKAPTVTRGNSYNHI